MISTVIKPQHCLINYRASNYLASKRLLKKTLAAALMVIISSAGLADIAPDVVADAVAGDALRLPLSLPQAIAIAQQNDPWLSGSRLREQLNRAKSVSVGQLPDPLVSLGFANLPVDSFEFSQEPMSQFTLGVSQAFPRGDTRALQQQQFEEISQQQPLLREDRKAKLQVAVSQVWLDLYKSRETIRLIEKDRSLFEQLVAVVHSSYSNALGRARQQDLVRAQLELTRLNDRLTVLQQQQDVATAALGEWLINTSVFNASLPARLPQIMPSNPWLINEYPTDRQAVAAVLQQHPMIKNFDQQLASSATGVELAKQKYKPQWGINASYGYRDDDPMGNHRSDFFSVGVSFDVPLFTAKRQDKEVQAAVYSQAALKTDKALALRSMHARFEALKSRLLRLKQRQALYQNRLLQEIRKQAEASLTAYTRDDGDFSEVVRARIAELDANIDFLTINVERLKTTVELNYFMASAQGTSNSTEPVSAYE